MRIRLLSTISLLVAWGTSPLFGQQVLITNVRLAGDNVVLSYNLSDEKIERRYALHLYTSGDNYIQPLQLVSGDIGIDISVGDNKEVIWNAKEELGDDYSGDLALELKGTVYIPFIYLDGFDDYKVFKRSKPYDVTWSGGRGDNVLSFELYKNDRKIKVFEERPNVGNSTIVIGTDVKPGRGYRLKISDSRNKDEVIFTDYFRVARRIPLVLKIGALVGVGTLVTVLSQSDKQEPIIEAPPKPNR
ncbi:MAG: hypothetical protein KDC99_17845 [Cyclobacteriaceae bacterium]|nr:hypothetical protein [Cyclobacteriaceae bacterium]